jgi:hypothetical protein
MKQAAQEATSFSNSKSFGTHDMPLTRIQEATLLLSFKRNKKVSQLLSTVTLLWIWFSGVLIKLHIKLHEKKINKYGGG